MVRKLKKKKSKVRKPKHQTSNLKDHARISSRKRSKRKRKLQRLRLMKYESEGKINYNTVVEPIPNQEILPAPAPGKIVPELSTSEMLPRSSMSDLPFNTMKKVSVMLIDCIKYPDLARTTNQMPSDNGENKTRTKYKTNDFINVPKRKRSDSESTIEVTSTPWKKKKNVVKEDQNESERMTTDSKSTVESTSQPQTKRKSHKQRKVSVEENNESEMNKMDQGNVQDQVKRPRKTQQDNIKVKRKIYNKKSIQKVATKTVRVVLVDCLKYPELAGLPTNICSNKIHLVQNEYDVESDQDKNSKTDFEPITIDYEEEELGNYLELCDYCDSVFQVQSDLEAHVAVYHAKIKEGLVSPKANSKKSHFSSANSPSKFNRTDQLVYQRPKATARKTKSMTLTSSTSTDSMTCFICHKEFNSKKALQSHSVRAHVHECPFCLLTFSTLKLFEKHVERMHSEHNC